MTGGCFQQSRVCVYCGHGFIRQKVETTTSGNKLLMKREKVLILSDQVSTLIQTSSSRSWSNSRQPWPAYVFVGEGGLLLGGASIVSPGWGCNSTSPRWVDQISWVDVLAPRMENFFAMMQFEECDHQSPSLCSFMFKSPLKWKLEQNTFLEFEHSFLDSRVFAWIDGLLTEGAARRVSTRFTV